LEFDCISSNLHWQQGCLDYSPWCWASSTAKNTGKMWTEKKRVWGLSRKITLNTLLQCVKSCSLRQCVNACACASDVCDKLVCVVATSGNWCGVWSNVPLRKITNDISQQTKTRSSWRLVHYNISY
jgi:hypothetical protein